MDQRITSLYDEYTHKLLPRALLLQSEFYQTSCFT